MQGYPLAHWYAKTNKREDKVVSLDKDISFLSFLGAICKKNTSPVSWG